MLLQRDIVCEQAVELASDYLEGTLSRRDRRRYEHHLKGCPHCTEYLQQMRETIRLRAGSSRRTSRHRCRPSSASSTGAGARIPPSPSRDPLR